MPLDVLPCERHSEYHFFVKLLCESNELNEIWEADARLERTEKGNLFFPPGITVT